MRASKAMQHRVMGMENIEIHFNTETVDILGAEQVEGVQVINNVSKEESTLDVTGFFLAIGHKPNTDIFAGQVNLDEEGYIIAAKPGSAYTNVDGVFSLVLVKLKARWSLPLYSQQEWAPTSIHGSRRRSC